MQNLLWLLNKCLSALYSGWSLLLEHRLLPHYLLSDHCASWLLRSLENSLPGVAWRSASSQGRHLSRRKDQLAPLHHRVGTQQDPSVALHQHLPLRGLDQLATQHLRAAWTWGCCSSRGSTCLRCLGGCWEPRGSNSRAFHNSRDHALLNNTRLHPGRCLLAALKWALDTFYELCGLLLDALRYLSDNWLGIRYQLSCLWR